MVCTAVYPVAYPKYCDDRMPVGTATTLDVSTDDPIEPIMFHPAATAMLSFVRGVPLKAFVPADGNFPQ
jgi:hypothetical protein